MGFDPLASDTCTNTLMGTASGRRVPSLQCRGVHHTPCRQIYERECEDREGVKEMRVLVENLTGRFLYVDVGEEEEGAGAGATVGELKRGISAASEEAIEEERMILVTDGGRVMADDRASLSQYGVREWSVVYIYFFPNSTTRWHRSYEDYITLDDNEEKEEEEEG